MAEAKAMIFIRIDSKLFEPFNGLFGITFEPEQPANDFQALQNCFYSMVPDSLEKLKTNLAFNIAMLLVSVITFIALFEGGCVLVERFVSFLRGIVHSRNAAFKKGLKISSNPNNDKLLTICIPARKKFENIRLRGLSNVAVKSIARPALKLPCEPFLLPAGMVVFLQTGFPTNGPRVHLIISFDMFEIFLANLERNVSTKANALLTKLRQCRVQDLLTPSFVGSPIEPLRSTQSSQNIEAVSKSPQQVFFHCMIEPVKSTVKRPITQICSTHTVNSVRAQSLSVASQTFQFVATPIPTQTIRKCFMPALIQTVNPILKSSPTQTFQSVGKPASTQTSISTTAPISTQTIGQDSNSSKLLVVSNSTQTFQRTMRLASMSTQTSKSAGMTVSSQTISVGSSPVSTQTTTRTQPSDQLTPDTGTLQKRQSATTFTQTIFGTVRMLPALKPRSKYNKGTQTTTLPARAGQSTSKKAKNTDKSSVVAKRLRPVLSKSHVVVTSYPGSDELGGFLDPEHEYCLQKWSKRKHPFVKIPKFSNDDIIKAINKLPNDESVETTPTEKEWERYYQEELADQAKEDAQRLAKRADNKRKDINSFCSISIDTPSKDTLLVVNDIMKAVNQLPKKKHVRQSPTEEDWERYYQDELAEQAKEDAQRLAKKARSEKSTEGRSAFPSKNERTKSNNLASAGCPSKLRTPNQIKTAIKVSTSQLTASSSSHKASNGPLSKLCPPTRLKAPHKVDSSSKLRAPTNHKAQIVVRHQSKLRQPSKLERPVSKRCGSNLQITPKDLSDALKMVPKIKASPISESPTFHVPIMDRKKEDDWMANIQRALTTEKLFRIQDDPEHRCTSSAVVGKMRKPTRMRRRILEEVDFLDEIKELAEPLNLVPCMSGAPRLIGKIKPDDANFFDLEPQLLDFVDEFTDDLPLITNEDIRQLCDRTPHLYNMTDAQEQEVEAWLHTCNIPSQKVDPLMF